LGDKATSPDRCCEEKQHIGLNTRHKLAPAQQGPGTSSSHGRGKQGFFEMPIQSCGWLFPGCFSSNVPVPQVEAGAAYL
jgi:hypothetical protein